MHQMPNTLHYNCKLGFLAYIQWGVFLLWDLSNYWNGWTWQLLLMCFKLKFPMITMVWMKQKISYEKELC